MRTVKEEALAANNGRRGITGDFDRTWQNYCYISCSGVVAATATDTDTISDVESLTKHCGNNRIILAIIMDSVAVLK